MKHIHHIIPKYMGGTDEPSNLVELTVEEHAEAHRILFEQYGRKEDKRAWLGLAKMMSKEEIIQEIISQPKSEEWKEKNRKPKKDTSRYFGNTNAKSLAGKPKTEEHKKNISLAHKGKKRGSFTAEWLQALKDAKAKEPIKTCPHCGVVGKGANMTRYHFEKCKVK
jgi:hypothetical protein